MACALLKDDDFVFTTVLLQKHAPSTWTTMSPETQVELVNLSATSREYSAVVRKGDPKHVFPVNLHIDSLGGMQYLLYLKYYVHVEEKVKNVLTNLEILENIAKISCEFSYCQYLCMKISSHTTHSIPNLNELEHCYRHHSLFSGGIVTGEGFKDAHSLLQIRRTLSTSVTEVQRVQNPYLWGAYMLHKEQNPSLQELELFHATAKSNVKSITTSNFDWRRTVRSKFGKGVSFSPSAEYADKYCNKKAGTQRALILSRVLVGTEFPGSQYTEIPREGYDTTTGNGGQVYVKYGDNEYYPEYVAYYANDNPYLGRRRGLFGDRF